MMNGETACLLARMTADFYAARAADFSATRQGSWAGWQQLAAQVQPLFEEAARMGCPVAVADVACGNGRFGKFLRQKFPQSPLRYTGWDGNEALLREAAANMPEGAVLHRADVLAPLLGEERDPWWAEADRGAYQLVASFGFLHHIPGAENRARFLGQLLDLAQPGGTVALSLWRFADHGPLREKALRSTETALAAVPALAGAGGLEPGDYLLGWGGDGQAAQNPDVAGAASQGADAAAPLFRYCHSFSDEEARALVASVKSRACLTASFFSDGRTGALNQYLLLVRED